MSVVSNSFNGIVSVKMVKWRYLDYRQIIYTSHYGERQHQGCKYEIVIIAIGK